MKRKYLFGLSCLLLIIRLAPEARADERLPNPVHTWNRLALDTVRTGRLSDAQAARLYAMINVAMYDAVNGIKSRRGHVKRNPALVDPVGAPNLWQPLRRGICRSARGARAGASRARRHL